MKPPVDFAFRENPRDAAGDGADDEEPGEPPIRIGADFPFDQAGEAGADEPRPIRGEEPQYGRKRAHVQGHVERQAGERRGLPLEQPRDDDQMGRAGNGDVLGQPLHDAQDDRLQEGCHARSGTVGVGWMITFRL
jgi:hypothetical protein